ncbi:reverse transcriptase domain-containing protein [Tanacetum coccineum]
MLERLAEHEYYCFLDGFSRYFQILVAPEDQEKTTFNCPYGTMAYKRMPFGLCNAPTTFQHCMMAIFHELIEDSMEIFMNDFSISGSSFDHCLQNLEKMLKRLFGPIQNHRLHRSLCLTVSLHKQDAKLWLIRWTLLLQEFDIKIRDKKGVENLAPDHHSRLENPNLGKLNKAEIKDLFSEEQLMTISDRGNEPSYVDYANYLASRTKSYEDASLVVRQPKCFNNVTADHQGDIMGSTQPQGKSSKPGSTGIDFMGSFSLSNGNKYILVAIDYVSKWVEAQAFPTSDPQNIVNFLKILFFRFGIQKALISDRGTHFCNYQMEREMKRYGVVHRFSTAYYLQTNGQVKTTNRAIKRILEKTIGNNRKEWSNKLDDALWAFLTMFKTPLGTISFRIIYGKACHLPVELEHKAY